MAKQRNNHSDSESYQSRATYRNLDSEMTNTIYGQYQSLIGQGMTHTKAKRQLADSNNVKYGTIDTISRYHGRSADSLRTSEQLSEGEKKNIQALYVRGTSSGISVNKLVGTYGISKRTLYGDVLDGITYRRSTNNSQDLEQAVRRITGDNIHYLTTPSRVVDSPQSNELPAVVGGNVGGYTINQAGSGDDSGKPETPSGSKPGDVPFVPVGATDGRKGLSEQQVQENLGANPDALPNRAYPKGTLKDSEDKGAEGDKGPSDGQGVKPVSIDDVLPENPDFSGQEDVETPNPVDGEASPDYILGRTDASAQYEDQIRDLESQVVDLSGKKALAEADRDHYKAERDGLRQKAQPGYWSRFKRGVAALALVAVGALGGWYGHDYMKTGPLEAKCATVTQQLDQSKKDYQNLNGQMTQTKSEYDTKLTAEQKKYESDQKKSQAELAAKQTTIDGLTAKLAEEAASREAVATEAAEKTEVAVSGVTIEKPSTGPSATLPGYDPAKEESKSKPAYTKKSEKAPVVLNKDTSVVDALKSIGYTGRMAERTELLAAKRAQEGKPYALLHALMPGENVELLNYVKGKDHDSLDALRSKYKSQYDGARTGLEAKLKKATAPTIAPAAPVVKHATAAAVDSEEKDILAGLEGVIPPMKSAQPVVYEATNVTQEATVSQSVSEKTVSDAGDVFENIFKGLRVYTVENGKVRIGDGKLVRWPCTNIDSIQDLGNYMSMAAREFNFPVTSATTTSFYDLMVASGLDSEAAKQLQNEVQSTGIGADDLNRVAEATRIIGTQSGFYTGDIKPDTKKADGVIITYENQARHFVKSLR